MPAPRGICTNPDGSIWVFETDSDKFYKYNESGNVLLISPQIETEVTYLYTDYNNGCWAYNTSVDKVFHFNSSGVQDLEIYIDQLSRISTSHEGCLAWSSGPSTYKYIGLESGIVERTYTRTAENYPAIVSLRYEDDLSYGQAIVPVSYDPVWGTGGSLEWTEVRKDGYFLPKVRFHQAAITLRGAAELEKVIIAPAVKTEDIQPGQSKNMYVKTDIPIDADITDYEMKLRTWWGVED
jgi:hypothetical protein